jgi:rod shape-determining protein MreB
MLDRLFANHAYVRVRRNQFRVRHLESGTDTTIQAQIPFTSLRMLVGDFTAADQALKAALRDVVKGRLIPVRPRVLIQPLELIEGGLSQIEERILRELAIGAGASKVVVWVGSELTDTEVRQKLNGK